MQKIFIVSANKNLDTQYTIAEAVSEELDLEIAHSFTTGELSDSTYFDTMCIGDVTIAFKNNSLLYCESLNETDTIGITIDEYYNKDIFCTSVIGFNNIADNILTDDILVIWLDCAYSISSVRDLNEAKYLIETLEDMKYLYFSLATDDLQYITNMLHKYFNASDSLKAEIEQELS